jgi:hypothetical protein
LPLILHLKKKKKKIVVTAGLEPGSSYLAQDRVTEP